MAGRKGLSAPRPHQSLERGARKALLHQALNQSSRETSPPSGISNQLLARKGAGAKLPFTSTYPSLQGRPDAEPFTVLWSLS